MNNQTIITISMRIMTVKNSSIAVDFNLYRIDSI